MDGVSLGRGDAARNGHLLTSMDPPVHTRMRRLIAAGFTPRMVGRLEELIVTRSQRILDEVVSRGECDFVAEVAYALPMHVIGDIVGIGEDDRPWVFERTDRMMRFFDTTAGVTVDEKAEAERDLFEYAQGLTVEKRSHPGDDVWTLIAQAVVTDDDGTEHRIEGVELEMFFLLLSLAGSETTRNAISQGLLALLEHPDQLAAVRADASLVPSAADEMIRWASPVLYFGRTATRDTELGGVPIAAGDRVVLWYVSGNRDERVFADPFRFDVRRSPNPHVAFGGGGPHYCLGANLAKKEVQSLMGALIEQLDIAVVGEPAWAKAGGGSNVGVSLNHLPVKVTRR
jgi:cytochrome P450